MPATLDLTWKQTASEDTPPAGKAPALYRGNTYSHTITVTDGTLNGYGAWTWTAQIRAARLTSSVSPAALASFTITDEPDGDDLLVHLLLPATTTLALSLPSGGFWDLQLESGGVVATWLAGKVKLLDDVSRAA